MRRPGRALLLFLLALAACQRPAIFLPEGGAGAVDAMPAAPGFSVQYIVGSRAVDVLAVAETMNSPIERGLLLPGYRALLEELLGRPELLAACQAPDDACQMPDLRFGWITTDLGAGEFALPSCKPGGDGARLWDEARRPGCSPPQDRWIELLDRRINVDGASSDLVQALAEVIDCITPPLSGGCSFAQPLEAARRALDPARGINPGFLRPHALLVLSLAIDVDDCSTANTELYSPAPQLVDELGPLTDFRCTAFSLACAEPMREVGIKSDCRLRDDWLWPISTYHGFFAGLHPGRVIASVIAGDAQKIEVTNIGSDILIHPACQGAVGYSNPAPRLKAFAESLGRRGLFNAAGVDSCARGFEPAFRELAATIHQSLESTCFSAPPLTAAGGIACDAEDRLAAAAPCQTSCLELADCQVEDVSPGGRRPIARCPVEDFDPQRSRCAGVCPCWRLVRAPELCQEAGAPPYATQVLRPGGLLAPSGGYARATCRTSTWPWGSPRLLRVRQCR